MKQKIEAMLKAIDSITPAVNIAHNWNNIENKWIPTKDYILKSKVIELLTELLSNAEGEVWISVEERLPEDWKEYPVRIVRRSTGLISIKMSKLNPAKTGFYVEFSDDGDFQLEDVTDWFDLPAPSQPQKGERV